MHGLGNPNDFDELTDDEPTHERPNGDIQRIAKCRAEHESRGGIVLPDERVEYAKQMFQRFSRVIDEQSEFLHKMKGRSHNREIIQTRIDEIKVLQNRLNEFSSEMTVDNFDSLKIADFIHEIDNDLIASVFYKGIKKVKRGDKYQVPKYIEAVFKNMRGGFDVSLDQVGALLDSKVKWEPKKKDTVPPATFKPTEEQMDDPGFDAPLSYVGPSIERGSPYLEEETIPGMFVDGCSSGVEQLVSGHHTANREAFSITVATPAVIPAPMILEDPDADSAQDTVAPPTIVMTIPDLYVADDTLVPAPEDEVSSMVDTPVTPVDAAPQVEELPLAYVLPETRSGFREKIRSAVSSIFGRPLRSMTAMVAALGLAATIPHLNSADSAHAGNVEIKTTMSAATSESALQQVSTSAAISIEVQSDISDLTAKNVQDEDSAKPATSIWDSVEGRVIAENSNLSPDELVQVTAEQTNDLLRDNHNYLVGKLENSGFFKSKAFFADVKDMLEDAGGFNIPKEATSFWDIKNSLNLSVEAKNTLLEQGAACMLDSGEIGGLTNG